MRMISSTFARKGAASGIFACRQGSLTSRAYIIRALPRACAAVIMLSVSLFGLRPEQRRLALSNRILLSNRASGGIPRAKQSAGVVYQPPEIRTLTGYLPELAHSLARLLHGVGHAILTCLTS